MTLNNSQLIFEKWQAELSSKDRKKASLPTRFDELFEELKSDGTDFAVAHAILPQAIKALHPPKQAIKATYLKFSKIPGFSAGSEKEYADEWLKGIAATGTESFYAFFEIKSKDDDDDKEPKVYGSMSAREYALQRRYAESFPILDTAALEERMNQAIQYNLDNAINILGETDGKFDK